MRFVMASFTRFRPNIVSSLKPRGRWIQFSLKSLLVVVLALSLPLGWMASKLHAKHRERSIGARVLRFGGQVGYRWEQDVPGRPRAVASRVVGQPPGPKWMRRILGEDFFTSISRVALYQEDIDDARLTELNLDSLRELSNLTVNCPLITDRSLTRVCSITTLESLDLSGTQVTDSGLQHLTVLKGLKFLALNETQVTDGCLVSIGVLTSLEHIELTRTRLTGSELDHVCSLTHLDVLQLATTLVTDGELVRMQRLKTLRELDLSFTNVSDVGLVHLRGLSNLRRVNLRLTRVTEAGVAGLRQALPRCKVVAYGDNINGSMSR
jgi:hypothetical protein